MLTCSIYEYIGIFSHWIVQYCVEWTKIDTCNNRLIRQCYENENDFEYYISTKIKCERSDAQNSLHAFDVKVNQNKFRKERFSFDGNKNAIHILCFDH